MCFRVQDLCIYCNGRLIKLFFPTGPLIFYNNQKLLILGFGTLTLTRGVLGRSKADRPMLRVLSYSNCWSSKTMVYWLLWTHEARNNTWEMMHVFFFGENACSLISSFLWPQICPASDFVALQLVNTYIIAKWVGCLVVCRLLRLLKEDSNLSVKLGSTIFILNFCPDGIY